MYSVVYQKFMKMQKIIKNLFLMVSGSMNPIMRLVLLLLDLSAGYLPELWATLGAEDSGGGVIQGNRIWKLFF